jgi:hypothetical protein
MLYVNLELRSHEVRNEQKTVEDNPKDIIEYAKPPLIILTPFVMSSEIFQLPFDQLE